MKNGKKGMGHVDFIIAASFFILIFAIVVQTMTTFFTNAQSTAQIGTLSGRSISMLSVADFASVPQNWTGSGTIERMGLATTAYRFYIQVNNTKVHMINQSQNVTDLTSELVSFNYTTMGFSGIDVNSTKIYDEARNSIPYQVDGARIIFAASVATNSSVFYTVYFDDDSNFTTSSTTVSAFDRVNEVVYPAYPIVIVQYKKLVALNSSSYSQVSDYVLEKNFGLSLTDVDSSAEFFSFGGEVPLHGDVVALQRYVIFQNSTGGIRNGRLVVKTW